MVYSGFTRSAPISIPEGKPFKLATDWESGAPIELLSSGHYQL